MDPDSGLLADLLSRRVVTHREMETVRAGRTFYDRNEQLLSVMRRKTESEFREFVAALARNEMKHLAAALETHPS